MAKTVRDYSSIYGVKDFIYNDIAPNYFEDLDDMSTLNVGLLGLTTDISSTVAFDAMQVISTYITQTLPGKATLPEFIYAHAANYGISDLFAPCATCRAVLIINQEYILENGTKNGKYIDYVIPDDIVIFVEDVRFSIPYPIRIRSSVYGETYNHKCSYMVDGFTNSVYQPKYPFIKCNRMKIHNESGNYLALTVTLCQYYKTVQLENVITNNKLNIPYIDIDHPDLMCNFEVLYKPPGSTKQTQLLKLLETTQATSTPFAYYKLIDEDTYRIFFSNDDRYFIPEYNSELEIITYQTMGEKGNFPQYKGDNIHVETTDGSAMFCVIVSESSGGANSLTLEQINYKTWEAMTTIKSYTTDFDLNQFFTLTHNSIYNTTAYFIKTQDDFANRMYACYMRLKNDTDIFPTNTLECDITLDKIDTSYQSQDKYIISAGSRFVYADDTTRSLCKIIGDDDPAPEDGIEYSNIGLISLSTNPNSIAFYMNSIDKNVNVVYTELNDNSVYQFIMSNFHVQRDAVLGDNTYTFDATIVPSDLTIVTKPKEDSIIDDTISGSEDATNNFDPTKIHMYILFRQPKSDEGHYLIMEYDEETSSKELGYKFTGHCSTDDLIMKDKIQLIDLIPTVDTLSSYMSAKMENPDMEILIFYDEGEEGDTNHQYKFIKEAKDLTLTNVFNPDEDEMYFAYALSMMRTTVLFKESLEDDKHSFYFHIKDMPLFARDFLYDREHLSEALIRLNSEHGALVNVMSQITSNFAISLKFFNTYGRSNTFTINDGNNTLLNRTNCDIELDIKFMASVDVGDTIPYIKRSIKTYIESICDNDNSNINMINMSTLVTKLHEEYKDDIEYIVFKSINGYCALIQSINMEIDLTESENCGMIPEFLNISLDNIKITEI